MKKATKQALQADMVSAVSAAVGATLGTTVGHAIATEVHADASSSPIPVSIAEPTEVMDDIEIVATAPNCPMEPPTTAPASAAEDAPEIVVTNYGTVMNADGSRMDVAMVNIDDMPAAVIDVDRDGVADIIMADLNGNGVVDEGEAQNVEELGISMSELQAAVEPPFMTEADYVNDADVDAFLA